jgi:hypothetical protein
LKSRLNSEVLADVLLAQLFERHQALLHGPRQPVAKIGIAFAPQLMGSGDAHAAFHAAIVADGPGSRQLR